ncbi:MAG: malonic semialdehyde reductase [Nocardioidaceae bacterium]|nr:malonic semialdehyde reductase [Nocardioidaceae bacterium]
MSENVAQLERLDSAGRELLFTHARTAYSFADTPVSDEQLEEIWSLAKWAPTGANLQPLRVQYVRTEAGKQRLVPLLDEMNRAKTTSAPVAAILAVDTRFHEHVPTVMPVKPELQDFFEANPEMREGLGGFNGSIQVGYFILAVRAAGLAAGPMGGFDKAAVDAEFFPGGRYRSQLVVNIGHPAGEPEFPRLPRLDHDTALTWA